MTILGISGWLQPPEALCGLLPGIKPFRYDYYGSDKTRFMRELAATKPEVVIGWSLGGVLAVQGLLHPDYRPRKLVLIAAPYRFLAAPDFPDGMALEDYEAFRRDYIERPKTASHRLQWLTNHGMPEDAPLCPAAENAEETDKWLPWLEHLAATNFTASNYPWRPEVLLIQGGKDAVCAPAQSRCWTRLFPLAKVLVLPKAAHAPHVQEAAAVRRTVAEFLQDVDADLQAAAG